MPDLVPGTRLRSAAGPTEIIVTRAPADAVVVTCAGQPMEVLGGAAAATPGDASAGESDVLLGKRYVDETSGLELLCTKGGPGPIEVDGRVCAIKSAKPLPSSD